MREREEQGASGVLGFAPVLPQLTLRQLTKVDADGVPASQGIVAATSRLQRRRAEREAMLSELVVPIAADVHERLRGVIAWRECQWKETTSETEAEALKIAS